ncbi:MULTISPECIES: Maf family protein [Microvirgula]|uniref:dTTP/UTP pyrophosphatase n=1 Tax=Microvirgula aerodenitrificans TaxID=57480 RepID=A0A2S0P8L8_9NEIS|nr:MULTISPECIES: Maf family protein [Microvirgula]AVY93637.1 septum formation inhibitor Maf [Microvirgula aerodenitrificans]RAS20185.1 septum formation protein [Microvirgula sp. AG722]
MTAVHTLYLASASPRRKKILNQLGLMTARIRADIDESRHYGESPREYVVRLAREKAAAGWAVVEAEGLPARPLLAADTTVALGDEIFGKPADADEARRMLRRLSGTVHEVFTSVAVRLGGRVEVATSVSKVTFSVLSERQIDAYVASGEPMDKAGAYGIQGRAGLFVAYLEGSYSGVMGLPVHETGRLLATFGIDVLAA